MSAISLARQIALAACGLIMGLSLKGVMAGDTTSIGVMALSAVIGLCLITIGHLTLPMEVAEEITRRQNGAYDVD